MFVVLAHFLLCFKVSIMLGLNPHSNRHQITHRRVTNMLHNNNNNLVTNNQAIHNSQVKNRFVLTLTLPGPSAGVSGSLDSYCSLKPLCSGMGEVVPARTSPTLLPPSPRTVLSLSCFKVLQCINCRDWHCKS